MDAATSERLRECFLYLARIPADRTLSADELAFKQLAEKVIEKEEKSRSIQ
jgi:hypothetical protein